MKEKLFIQICRASLVFWGGFVAPTNHLLSINSGDPTENQTSKLFSAIPLNPNICLSFGSKHCKSVESCENQAVILHDERHQHYNICGHNNPLRLREFYVS